MIKVTEAIAQGDQTYQRNGNKISFKTLMGRMRIFLETTADTTLWSGNTPIVRMIIFSDRYNQGVYPTKTEMLENAANAWSFLNWNNRKRFRILKDKFIKLDSPQAWTNNAAQEQMINKGPYTKLVKFRIKFKKNIFYKGATEAEASNGPGAIFITFWKVDTAGGVVYADWTLRFNFQDL